MSWNYRIIKRKVNEYTVYSLHEVYYDEVGNPVSYTLNPVSFYADEEEGIEEIEANLRMALADIKKHKPLSEDDFPKVT